MGLLSGVLIDSRLVDGAVENGAYGGNGCGSEGSQKIDDDGILNAIWTGRRWDSQDLNLDITYELYGLFPRELAAAHMAPASWCSDRSVVEN